MQKQQPLPILKHEIKKDKVPSFPYYAVCTIHEANGFHFLVTVDYQSNNGFLLIYPFKQDMSKLTTTTIQLENIMPHKIISIINVQNLKFKSTSSSVNIISLELLLGYRSGQIIVVQYKQKQFKIKCKLNKSLKSDGFMSRATSMFFGSDDTYTPYFNFPARNYSNTSQFPSFEHSYLVGNSILLSKYLSEQKQSKFLSQHGQIDLKVSDFKERKIIKLGDILINCCEYYTSMEDSHSQYKLLTMKEQVSSYILLPSKNQLYIASKQFLFILQIHNFTIKNIIKTQNHIRRINLSYSDKQPFLSILLYQNYFLWYSINQKRYIKIAGHKSFVANIYYEEKNKRLISAGMDHRICILSRKSIKQQCWTMIKENGELLTIKEIDTKQIYFDDTYGLGSYNNSKGKSVTSYGYGDLMVIGLYYCLPTFDNKINIYEIK